MTETTSHIVTEALAKWEALTGVSMDQRSFSLSGMSVGEMNEIMQDALKLDPAGTTTYLMLEFFLRRYLEQKTFTAAQIMRDYAKNASWLAQAEELFSVVQSDTATEIAADFRARVTKGVQRYNVATPDVLAMIDNPDTLPFLRRDALHSHEALTPFQFLAGVADPGPAQVIDTVYIAWDVNKLLIALRDMPVSGIAVVLLRDPAHPDRSHFCFAMRNGGNVTLLTDKSRPAYPGQEDVLAGRGGRGAARTFDSREWANHFPYHLIKTGQDEKGETTFLKETQPVAAGLDMAPLMRLKDLPAHQVIWLTMMMALISDRYWKAGWQAPALSYTGAMVRQKDLMIADAAHLPAVRDYQPIDLDALSIEDVSTNPIAEVTELKVRNKGVNDWMEKRYAQSVDAQVINLWPTAPGMIHELTSVSERYGKSPDPTALAHRGVVSMSPKEHSDFFRSKGYRLNALSTTAFGTEAELRADVVYTARHNLGEHIQREADKEFKARHSDILGWFRKAVTANRKALLLRAAIGEGDEADPILKVGHIKSTAFEYDYDFNIVSPLNETIGSTIYCPVTDAKVSIRARFAPQTAEDLASLAGCEVSQLPDVLQNWSQERVYVGNHLLTRLDPIDAQVTNPWNDLRFTLNIFFSKRGIAQKRKERAAINA
jgi:hypothetical protein